MATLPQTACALQTTFIVTQNFVPFTEIRRIYILTGLRQCALADGTNDWHVTGFRSSASLQSFLASLSSGYHDIHKNKRLLLITRTVGVKSLSQFLLSRLIRYDEKVFIYYGTSKNCAIPSLHRDRFMAKVPGPVAGACVG